MTRPFLLYLEPLLFKVFFNLVNIHSTPIASIKNSTALAFSSTLALSEVDEDGVKVFLAIYDAEYSKRLTEVTHASWNYETNLTDYNEKILVRRRVI